MIIRCEEKNKNGLLNYIGEDYYKCIYLYMNLFKYGCESENIEVYASCDDKEQINGVFLKYFDCLHVFSKNEDLKTEDLNELFIKCQPRVSFVSEEIKNMLNEQIIKNYNVFYDTLFEAVHFSYNEEDSFELFEATADETEEITDFLMSDAFYASIYERESLKKQIFDRMADKYSRSFISRNDSDSKIVFHMGTTAELPDFVIGGLGLLDISERGKGLGKIMFGKFYNKMLCEGRKCYCFPADDRAYELHKALGFKIKHKPVKLVRK